MADLQFFEEIKRYVRWAPSDETALRELSPFVAPHVVAISEEFYERIREHPEADKVFRDEAQVRSLQHTLQRWVLETLNGPFDEKYFERRCRIGALHSKIGLPQRYMFTAMTLIRLHLKSIASETYRDSEKLEPTLKALSKILDIELAIMLETFREAIESRMLRVEELERTGLARQLAAAEERYRDAIETAELLVIVLDHKGHTLLWNRKAARLTGYERDEMLSSAPLELLIPDEDAKEQLLAASPGQPVTLESTMRTRVGRERWVRWFVSVNIDPELALPIRYLMGVDLTDIRATERRVRNAERLAAVGTMAAGLAHEIRNPLNAASLHLALLDRALRNLPSAPDVARESTAVVKDEIHRLSTLVNEFLEFARPRPLNLNPMDVLPLLQRVVDLVQPDADGAHISLVFEKPTHPLVAAVDAERFHQVILNLVRNAMDAVTGTSRKIVTVRARRVAERVEIDVEDTGPGFPENAPIFDAFFTTKKGGTGLGLALVHRLVDGHSGSVTASRQSDTTVFTIKLPAA
ncbi:MAG: protoglobin domain-containing protein [Polyangiaceae bacterium]